MKVKESPSVFVKACHRYKSLKSTMKAVACEIKLSDSDLAICFI